MTVGKWRYGEINLPAPAADKHWLIRSIDGEFTKVYSQIFILGVEAVWSDDISDGDVAAHDFAVSKWRPKTEDTVNHPTHYTKTKVEPIDPIEAWAETWPVKVAFHLGNAVKYIARAGLKGNTLEDLKKAQWYLNRAISTLEKTE